MRKLLLVMIAVLALASPALAAPFIDVPAGFINFDGNGSFDTVPPGSFDPTTGIPNAQAINSELYGVGTISGAALMSDLGSPVWQASDLGASFEMTFSFWDAVVTSSALTPIGGGKYVLSADYSDVAQLVLVADTSKDFTAASGPGAFNLVTGYYPTAYELGADTDEDVYLVLTLSGNSSAIIWDANVAAAAGNPIAGFLGGSFSSTAVEIVGGYGASHFIDYLGPDGQADAFVLTFTLPPAWQFGADIDIQLHAVPEPAALISLCAGLVLLGGYRLRRKA